MSLDRLRFAWRNTCSESDGGGTILHELESKLDAIEAIADEEMILGVVKEVAPKPASLAKALRRDVIRFADASGDEGRSTRTYNSFDSLVSAMTAAADEYEALEKVNLELERMRLQAASVVLRSADEVDLLLQNLGHV